MSAPILLLPLDDRPVNLDFPLLLARVASEQLVVPPQASLGYFLIPGDTEAVAQWLLDRSHAARAGVISLDMLAYGGLVASRTPVVTAEQALARIAALREAKRRNPALRLFAFNVIMRLTITGADAETRAAGRDIFRYAVLRDKVERLGDADAARELAEVTARIPPRLLEAFLQARARNHAVNRAALDLLADGVLDFLALVQEDTAPAGLHVTEQQALLAHARDLAVQDRMRIYAGTDEAAQTLLARLLLTEAGMTFPVAIDFRDAAGAESPALFEDVPLRETTRRHVDAVGGVSGDAGVRLAVHTFTPPQPDLFEVATLGEPNWDAALTAFPAVDVAKWLGQSAMPLAVADVAYCNGGDPHLIEALLAQGSYPDLLAYAGWNTAGNTLGTTLAHAAVRSYGLAQGNDTARDRAHRQALLVRLLDDCLYQSLVRGWAIHRVEELGASPLNLGAMAAEVSGWVDAAMQRVWRTLCERYPAAAALDRPFQAVLPWGRLFETRIICVE